MAGKNGVAAKVTDLVSDIIADLGYELVDVEYVKEGSKWYLRLYVDKEGGITIDDCQNVHEHVTDIIDAADPIQGPYYFEVSSPGLDRPLKTDRDFERYRGEIVEVSLYAPDEAGVKNYAGKLLGKSGQELTIEEETSGVPHSFDLSRVALVKRAIRF